MKLTIRRQILVLAVSGFLLVFVAGAIGYVCNARLAAAQRTARDAADAVSAVRSADTARTAFRGDVFAALVTRNSTERQAVLDQLGARVLTLRDGLATVAHLEPDLAKQVAAMDDPVDGMIATGQRVVTLSSRVDSDPGRVAAAAARPAFDEQYQRFDKALPALEAALQHKVDQASAQSAAAERDSQLLILSTAGLAAFVLGGSAVLLARRISRRVNATVRAARAVAAKDLTVEVEVTGHDELTEIAASLDEVVGVVRGALTEIGDGAHALTDASARLLDTSRQLSTGAETASDQARSATTNVEQVTGSIDATADATRGLQSSIAEIRAAVDEAVRVAGEAVELAAGTNSTIERLGVSSEEVGAVVNMITTIAGQTNLLALNATIEAARAGEQGKGFAVVAGEVKELSRETAAATEDIEAKVTAMRGDTGSAIEAIGRITEVIGRIHEIQQKISAAVEVQSDATRSIGTSAEVAARSSGDIARSIESVALATETTHGGATHTEAAAGELAELARRLRTVADQFRR